VSEGLREDLLADEACCASEDELHCFGCHVISNVFDAIGCDMRRCFHFEVVDRMKLMVLEQKEK
jgi:hypothetical protein